MKTSICSWISKKTQALHQKSLSVREELKKLLQRRTVQPRSHPLEGEDSRKLRKLQKKSRRIRLQVLNHLFQFRKMNMSSSQMIFTRMMRISQMMLKTSIHFQKRIQTSKKEKWTLKLSKKSTMRLRLRRLVPDIRRSRSTREEQENT